MYLYDLYEHLYQSIDSFVKVHMELYPNFDADPSTRAKHFDHDSIARHNGINMTP